MGSSPHSLSRRQVLQAAAAATGVAWAGATRAQKAPASPRPPRLVQLLDVSSDQQALSRDYSTGIRLALAERSSAGGRPLSLEAVELDGSMQSVDAAVRAVAADPSVLALVGAVGERVALASVATARAVGLEIAHVAPWLPDTRFDDQPDVLPLFASRDVQVRHALNSLAVTGVSKVGVVYATEGARQAIQPSLASASPGGMRLQTQVHTVPPGGDIEAFAAALPDSLPAVVLFLGGTIELARFTQALARRAMQRYVVCLADIDVTSLMQLGPGRGVPLIFSQVVPNPRTSHLPVVREYRDALKRFYDEAPGPASLAGYLAGRYASRVLDRLPGVPNRSEVRGAFAIRPALDLGGVAIDFARHGRGSSAVNQVLLQSDGKLIG